MKHLTTLENDIINYIIDRIDEYEGTEVSELHHELFNTDYWCIGYYEAEQEINKHCSVFEALDIIQTYENDNFGQTTTDISSSERVANMLVYILGEQILSGLQSVSKNWNDIIDDEIINAIKAELN